MSPLQSAEGRSYPDISHSSGIQESTSIDIDHESQSRTEHIVNNQEGESSDESEEEDLEPGVLDENEHNDDYEGAHSEQSSDSNEQAKKHIFFRCNSLDLLVYYKSDHPNKSK